MCVTIRRRRKRDVLSAAGAISERQSQHRCDSRKNGVYWFTGQNGVYGRVDPKTGKTDAWASPKGRGPYGIAATPSGDVWFVSLAGNYLAKVDPATGAATVVDPPTPGAGPRRVWSDSKGILWVSLWNAGAIGRYDPPRKPGRPIRCRRAAPVVTRSTSMTRTASG